MTTSLRRLGSLLTGRSSSFSARARFPFFFLALPGLFFALASGSGGGATGSTTFSTASIDSSILGSAFFGSGTASGTRSGSLIILAAAPFLTRLRGFLTFFSFSFTFFAGFFFFATSASGSTFSGFSGSTSGASPSTTTGGNSASTTSSAGSSTGGPVSAATSVSTSSGGGSVLTIFRLLRMTPRRTRFSSISCCDRPVTVSRTSWACSSSKELMCPLI